MSLQTARLNKKIPFSTSLGIYAAYIDLFRVSQPGDEGVEYVQPVYAGNLGPF